MAQGLERIPLAVDSDFQAQPVRANFPEAPAQDFKLVSFEPDQIQAQAATPAPRSMGTVATDTAYGMAKGAGSLAKGIGWLTGSEGLQQAGQDAEDYWGEKQSADLHRQLEAVGKAEGVSGTVASLWNNPGAIGDYIATSLPMMIPGMAVGNLGARGIVAYAGNAARGAALRAGATEAAAMQAGRIAAEKAAEKAAMRFAVGANMVGEGAVSGGVTGAEVEKFALERGATPEQAKAAANKSALMAGAWTTAGAGIGAGMETRAMLGKLKDTGIKGMAKNVGKEALEEAIQNPGEDYASYSGKVQFDPAQTFDPGKSAVLGAITGGVMGAGFHGAGRASAIMRGEREDESLDVGGGDQGDGSGPGSGPGGGSGALSGDVLGPEQINDQRGGPMVMRQPETYTQITPTALPRLALPAPDEGGPTDRQVSTAIGLLKHSPKASPELLQRLMRVDQTMATMLFNHWQGQSNGQVAGSEATEIPAQSDQGQGADLGGSGIVGGFSNNAVSFTPDIASPGAAQGGKPGMAMGTTKPDALTPLDVQAHAAATSPFNATPQPTEAQKQAGTYKKGHVKFQGMDISIENPAGSVRSGTDADGKAWENTLQHHYGYIRGSTAKDGDQVDVFIKPGAQTARTAYVIDQIDPKTGKYDEAKVVFGADSESDAIAIYQANYAEGWGGMGEITAMPMEQFKEWVKSGKTKKPLAYVEPKEIRAAARKPATANTLLKAIVNRGGISREIMSDVGADPAGRYMPGLFTKSGTTDLSALAGYLFDEDGFHQIHQDSPIGPARELEELIVRALGGEQIMSTAAMERGMQAEENAKIKDKAQRLGVKTVARKIEDIAADVLRIESQNMLDEETALEDEALVAYNETVDALRAAYGDEDAETFLEDLASKYQEGSHLNYLRNATIDIQEKINAQAVQSAENPQVAAEAAAGQGNGTGGTQSGDRTDGEEVRPALALSGQTPAEIRAEIAEQEAAEARRRAEDDRAAASERQARIDAEIASRQDIAADNFTLDAQVNDKAKQKKADAKRIDEQLAGQGDIFAQSNQEPRAPTPVAESQATVTSEPVDAGVAPGRDEGVPERQKDAKGNPIYKMGERVEYIGGQYEGRHGAISQVTPMVTTVLGLARDTGYYAQNQSTSYYYHVKTDNGADFMASPEEIRFEESKPESVVPDIAVDGMVIEPRRVLDGIGYAKRSAEGSRAAAQRAKKASNIADHKRQAVTQDEKAERYQAAWDAWAAKYPAEAEKLAPKPATPNVVGATPNVATAAAGDVLKAAGLKVTKTTTKNGKPVWEVGGNTREHSDMLKRLGGRWYGPKKVWSFYNDDPTPAITLKLGGQVTIAGTPTIQMPDKSLEQIAASSQPAAVKAQAELDAREQADDVDLGALFDEVLAEEMAPKADVGEAWWNSLSTPFGKRRALDAVGVTAIKPEVKWGYLPAKVQKDLTAIIGTEKDPITAEKVGVGETATDITDQIEKQKRKLREAKNANDATKEAEAEKAIRQLRQQAMTEDAPRTAGQAAASAAVNTAKGLQDTIAALGKLFGSNGSRLSSGLTFDEETYAKAKPLFASAVAHFKDAGSDLKETMRAVVQLVIDQFGPQVAGNMKDYVVRFMEDVKAGNVVYDESKEASNEGIGNPDGKSGGGRVDVGADAAAGERPGRDTQAGNNQQDRGDGAGRAGRGEPLDAMGQTNEGAGSGGQAAAGDRGRGNKLEGGQGVRGTEQLDGGNRNPPAVRNRPDEPAPGGVAKTPKAPSTEGVSVSGKSDFQITDEDRLGEGGQKTKARNNLAAIRMAKKLEAEDRKATSAEQKVLAKYVGWGGIKQIFDDAKADWTKERTELKGLLSDVEYAEARRSMLAAHYTSTDVVSGMWAAAQHLGFTGGRVLEPSVGVGNFFGLMPSDVRAKSQLFAVEWDKITSLIAKHLYPSAHVANAGFQDIEFPANSFDLVIGNPPFGKDTLYDKNHPELRSFSIHNFFFAKSIDKVRPGGVLQMVVSRHLMDAIDSTARDYLAERADLIGAIRLPDSAFKANAGTEVVTDIIFLQKREPGAARKGFDWSGTGTVTTTHPKTGETFDFNVNSYFVAHPEMIIGNQVPTGKMNNAPNQYNVEARDGESLFQGMGKALANLPKDIITPYGKALPELVKEESAVPEGTKVYGYYMAGNTVMQRLPDAMDKRQGQPVAFKDEKAPLRAAGMIDIRNALRNLMRAELAEGTPLDKLNTMRARLNTLYDDFQKKYGYINQPSNRRAFRDDPDLPLLESLEPEFDPGLGADAAKKRGEAARKPSAKRADIFTKRVLEPFHEVTSADSAQDALIASLNAHGGVDPDYMSELYGKPWDQIKAELGALVFHNPNGGWETADEYLSGNVKAKLKLAEAAAEANPDYLPNVEALRAVIPADMPWSKISLRLGSPWIPSDVMERFAADLWGDKGASIKFVRQVAKWSVKSDGGDETARKSTWGVTYTKLNGGAAVFSAGDVMEAIANNRAVVIKENLGSSEQPNWVNNEPATEAIRAKIQDMAAKFKEWIWEDEGRRERLATIYNENYNTDRRRVYDGSHLTLPGSSPNIQLRKHQKNGVWRAITDRVILLDQVVGAGKTFEMAAIAMELRRLGIARKPMFAVPNSLVKQWRDEFYKLYPNANVLAATEADFAKANRKRFFAKIATGDWDAVIVAHSSFKKVGAPADVEARILKEQLDEISDAIEQLKRDRGDRNIVRDMEKIKIRLSERMKALKDSGGKKDDLLSFDELGIDGLFVDEAHLFKNLFYYSQMRNVTGLGNPNGSGRAFDLFVKTQYLSQRYNNKALIGFATGTPVSNSLVEMFTMQRYLAWDKLKEQGLHLLDAWAGVYGDVQQVYEVHPSGTGYRLSTRFAKFVNLPSLMELYRSFADVVTMDDLKQQAKEAGGVFPIPKIKGDRPRNIVADRSEQQTRFFGVPEFGRDDKGSIAFKYPADLKVRKSDKDGKWYPWLPDGSKVGNEGFETEAEALAERDTLVRLPSVGWNSGSILWKFENLKKLTKDSKGKVNALSITNEARKAGLDFRLIDPAAPDFKGSKINIAVGEIVRIHKDWTADRGAQLVFCDLSVPKSARAAAASKERTAYVRGPDGAISEVKATIVTFEGMEGLSFLAVKRGGKGAEGGYALYDGLTGAHTGVADHEKKNAVALLKAMLEKAGTEWLEDLQDRYGEITDADIADYKDAQGKEEEAAEEGADDTISMSELLALAGGNQFSVYDDIRTKLIAKGIPEKEVAFIHDYDTATKKNELFKKVKSGEIRVLLGSTEKMGAGMNVQERLVALHHLDAPWRPSDLEQREGRIVRQGNSLYKRDPDGFEVEIMRYGTKQTYDTRMWQIIEHKAAGVEQLRKAGDDLLEIDDIGGEAANAADMKAAASGNPLILDEIKLRNEVKSLESQQFAYAQARATMQDKVRWYRGAPDRAEDRIAEVQPYIDAAEKNPAEPFAYTTADGKTITDKKDVATPISTAFVEAAKAALGETINAGTYRGLLLRLRKTMGGVTAYLGRGEKPLPAADYGIEDKFSPSGFFTRLDNAFDRVRKNIEQERESAKASVDQIPKLEAEIAKPFAREEALKGARTKHREVVSKLQKAGGGIELTPAMQKELTAAIEERTGKREGRIAEPSTTAPGQFNSPKLGAKFASAHDGVQWLSENMEGEGYRAIAKKILPFLRSVPIHYVKVGDVVPAEVADLLSNGAAAVAYQVGDIADGKDAIYILDGTGDTEEALLHEALHIATSRRLLDPAAAAGFSDIAKAIRSALYDAGARSTDQKFKQAVEFFRKEFRSPGELIAYGFSSPAFQDLLKLMAADGKFYTDYRTPAELAKVNKNAPFQKQKPIAVPEYSMWHRFVDAIRSLFGREKAYQKAYEQSIEANRAIARNNELASRVEFKTLEEKLHSLLDELLKTQEQSLSQKATTLPIRLAQGQTWGSPVESRTDDLLYKMQDKHVDLKRVQEGIKKAIGGIRDDIDAYLHEELFHGRAAKATEEFLERELQPFVGEMKQRGITMEALENFLWARHAAERNAQIAKINPDMPDGGSGLTDKQAADLMAGKDVTVGGQTVKGIDQTKLRSLNDLARKVDMMVAGNRILLETYELETPDTVAAWKGAYKHYVPLHREDADAPWAGPGTGMGYSVRGSSTKRATGSFRPVENILANLVLQRTRTITRGEKNRVSQSLYGLAKEMPNPEFWNTDDAPKIRTVENKAIYHVMDGQTEIANFTNMADAERKARGNPAWYVYQDWGDRVVEKIDPTFRSKPNVVWARFGGEDRFVIFNERDPRAARMAESIKNLDADDIGNLLGEASRWTRYFASINTQYNPIFGVINLFRDAGTGLLNLKSTPLEGQQKALIGNLYYTLPAIYKAVRTDRAGGKPTGVWADLWEEFQEVGGKTGYRDMFRNSHEQREALEKALDPKWWQDKLWGKALTLGGTLAVPEQFFAEKIGKPVFEWLSDYNTMMENGIRLSAYKVALDQGLNKERAASVAKNLTVNFNRKGQVARQAGALYAFFNASVQGTARMAETLHHGARPGDLLGKAGKQIVYGGMLLGSMQALMLLAAGFDDKEPPEFVRDRNIILPIPFGDKKYLTLPLPLGFHVLPAVGRISTEFVIGGFRNPGKHLVHILDVLADSFNPIGNAGLSMQTIAPTVLDPAAALAENKDWTGKPIYREDLSKLSPTPGHARTKDTATALSKGLAYALNAASGGTEFKQGLLSPTPDQIDYLIGQVTGGVGREVSKVMQTGGAMMSGEDLPPHKMPLVGRFYGDAKGQSAVSSRFYDNLKTMNEHQAEYMGLAKSGRSTQAGAYLKENPEAAMFREADSMQRYVSQLRKQKTDLMAKSAPREQVKVIEDRISKAMADFNQRVESIKNPPPKAPPRGMERVPAY